MSQPTPKRDERELERLEAISALERGPATPDVSALAPTAESEKLIENPALGFNSCSLCGHGGTSGSILARIREYVTFYANSDADLSDDMAIGRQEVSKSVMEILNEAEPVPAEFRMTVAEWQAFDEDRAPVPAPRLEWNDLEFNAIADGEPRWFVSETNGSVTAYWHSKSRDRARLKDKAEKLNALLSPPVGTQPEGN